MRTLREWLTNRNVEEKAGAHTPTYLIQVKKSEIYLVSNLPSLNRHEVGWKLHISLDCNQKNLKSAWNIAVTLCKGYKMRTAKLFIEPKKSTLPGREITIYLDTPTLHKESIADFCLNLEIGLAMRGIKPGAHKALADKPVTGSKYLSFRNDERYLSAEEETSIATLQKITKEMQALGLAKNQISEYVQKAGYTMQRIARDEAHYINQQEAANLENAAKGIYSWNPYHFPDEYELEAIDVSEAYPHIQMQNEKSVAETAEHPISHSHSLGKS